MTTEAVLVEARPPGFFEVREGLSRDRVVGARRRAFFLDKGASSEQLAEAVAILEKTLKTAQRVLGREHPSTCNYRRELAFAKLRRGS